MFISSDPLTPLRGVNLQEIIRDQARFKYKTVRCSSMYLKNWKEPKYLNIGIAN